MEPGYFDLVVIDEASQCDIASALPLLYRAKRSVIIGDPMQLRHISALTRPRDSELQNKHGLVETRVGWMYSVSSLFDVAASIVSPENIINLRDHHRSHADIIGFSNEAFYEGRSSCRYSLSATQATRSEAARHRLAGRKRCGSAPAGGRCSERRRGSSSSATRWSTCWSRAALQGTVGVVTPFRAQAQLLQSLIRAPTELEEVASRAELLVDTVHKFQGDERDVMFFSPVVSSGISPSALGFFEATAICSTWPSRGRADCCMSWATAVAASRCDVDYLERFAAYVNGLDVGREPYGASESGSGRPEYPTVMHPERVSDWERVFYRAMVAAGLKPIPQFSVEQYDLDFALIEGDRKLDYRGRRRALPPQLDW